MELRRQLEQMAWTQSFLQLQQDALAPAAFLDAWARHSKLMEQMHLSGEPLPFSAFTANCPAAVVHVLAPCSGVCACPALPPLPRAAAELADTSLLDSVKADIKMFGHVVVMSDSEAGATV